MVLLNFVPEKSLDFKLNQNIDHNHEITIVIPIIGTHHIIY